MPLLGCTMSLQYFPKIMAVIVVRYKAPIVRVGAEIATSRQALPPCDPELDGKYYAIVPGTGAVRNLPSNGNIGLRAGPVQQRAAPHGHQAFLMFFPG